MQDAREDRGSTAQQRVHRTIVARESERKRRRECHEVRLHCPPESHVVRCQKERTLLELSSWSSLPLMPLSSFPRDVSSELSLASSTWSSELAATLELCIESSPSLRSDEADDLSSSDS